MFHIIVILFLLGMAHRNSSAIDPFGAVYFENDIFTELLKKKPIPQPSRAMDFAPSRPEMPVNNTRNTVEDYLFTADWGNIQSQADTSWFEFQDPISVDAWDVGQVPVSNAAGDDFDFQPTTVSVDNTPRLVVSNDNSVDFQPTFPTFTAYPNTPRPPTPPSSDFFFEPTFPTATPRPTLTLSNPSPQGHHNLVSLVDDSYPFVPTPTVNIYPNGVALHSPVPPTPPPKPTRQPPQQRPQLPTKQEFFPTFSPTSTTVNQPSKPPKSSPIIQESRTIEALQRNYESRIRALESELHNLTTQFAEQLQASTVQAWAIIEEQKESLKQLQAVIRYQEKQLQVRKLIVWTGFCILSDVYDRVKRKKCHV
jgi:hypothetical protein